MSEGDAPGPDELLYGEPGYWQHWWDLVCEAQSAGTSPLTMNMVIPDDGSFVNRQWIQGFDPEIREHVLGGSLIEGRVIVPAAALGSPAEPLLDLGRESGFEVRVLSTAARFTLYSGRAVVLSEGSSSEEGSGTEVHRVLQGRAILESLEQFFETLWQLAVPWEGIGGETSRILHLLAQGWTDVKIADEMGLSMRTVSRRVSEAMALQGARSRFELGSRYGRLAEAGGMN